MKNIPAGEFKQTCLRVLDEVRETGEIVVITKRGVPVAQLCPVPRRKEADWKGAMGGRATLVDDLVQPAATADDWEVERS